MPEENETIRSIPPWECASAKTRPVWFGVSVTGVKKINLSIGGKGAINQREEFFHDRVFLCTHLEVQWIPCPA
jgi:hypothetical protein